MRPQASSHHSFLYFFLHQYNLSISMARGHPSAPIDMTVENDFTEHTERLDYGTVLITGGGPVGLMVATVLARYGVKSVVLERNESTTKYFVDSITR